MEKLSIKVLERALRDAVSIPFHNTTIQKEAIEFLTEANDDFEFWCEHANLNPVRVQKQMQMIKTAPEEIRNKLKKLKKLQGVLEIKNY